MLEKKDGKRRGRRHGKPFLSMVETTKQKESLFGLGGWTMPLLNLFQRRSKRLRLAVLQIAHLTETITIFTCFFQVLLKESMRASPSSSGSNRVSDTLLIHYFQLLYKRSLVTLHSSDNTHNSKENIMASDVHRVVRLYTPSTYVWDVASDIYTGVYPYNEDSATNSEWFSILKYDFPNFSEEDLHVEERTAALHAIFDRWRLVSPVEHGKAALKWAAWLLAMQRQLRKVSNSGDAIDTKVLDGNGKDAARVIANARTALAGLGDNNNLDLFERTWRRILERPEDVEEEEEIGGGDIIMDV